MFSDPRIEQYRAAARAMMEGIFKVDLPLEPRDELGDLGRALQELATALDKRFREMVELVRVTEKINAGLILEEVLDYIFDSFRPIIPYNRIGLALIQEEEQLVISQWARSDAEVIKIGAGYHAPLKGSSLETIIQTGRARIINDLEDHLRRHPESHSTRLIVEEGMRSSLTCPLIVLGKPIGFLFFSSMEKNTYQDAHVEIYRHIAGHLSTIIEKSRIYQQVLELNQLKNKFLGIAAHDLRNPLSVLSGFLKLFLDGTLGDIQPQQREILERMSRNCNSMFDLIDELLDVSAIESGKLELDRDHVDLAVFLRECFEDNRLLAGSKEIEIELDLEHDLPTLDLDVDRVQQVVNNLITNAIKFSYPGTTIRLRAHRENDRVRISVVDQGQGIPEAEISSLFTEFGRTSVQPTAGEKSTGLGLAICKRIVEAHGGRIGVESVMDEGSTFFFTLPLTHATSHSEPEAAQ